MISKTSASLSGGPTQEAERSLKGKKKVKKDLCRQLVLLFVLMVFFSYLSTQFFVVLSLFLLFVFLWEKPLSCVERDKDDTVSDYGCAVRVDRFNLLFSIKNATI